MYTPPVDGESAGAVASVNPCHSPATRTLVAPLGGVKPKVTGQSSGPAASGETSAAPSAVESDAASRLESALASIVESLAESAAPSFAESMVESVVASIAVSTGASIALSISASTLVPGASLEQPASGRARAIAQAAARRGAESDMGWSVADPEPPSFAPRPPGGKHSVVRTSTANLAIFGALAAAVVGLGVWADARRAPPRVVDVLPKSTAVVIEFDLSAMRAAGLDALRLPGELEKLDGVARGCADGPLASLDRVALALPGASLSGDLAIVGLGGKVRAQAVAECARQVIAARGGAPRTERRDDFTVVQDGDGARGVLLVRDGGPVLLGKGPWLDAVIEAAQGRAPTLRGDPLHDGEREARKGALAIATWSIPAADREAMRAQLPPDARVVADAQEVIVDARSDGHGGASVVLEATCAPGTCDALSRWVDGAKRGFAREPFVEALGLGDAIRDANVGAQRDRVRLSLPVAAPALSAISSAGRAR